MFIFFVCYGGALFKFIFLLNNANFGARGGWENRTLSSVVVDRFLNRFGKQGDPPAGEEDRLCSEEDSEVSPLDFRFSSSDESSKRSGTSNCKMAWRIPASFLMLFDLFFTLYKRKKYFQKDENLSSPRTLGSGRDRDFAFFMRDSLGELCDSPEREDFLTRTGELSLLNFSPFRLRWPFLPSALMSSRASSEANLVVFFTCGRWVEPDSLSPLSFTISRHNLTFSWTNAGGTISCTC